PFRNEGTPSSRVAVQITRVWPISIKTLPSATGTKSGVNFTGRNWSQARPSARKLPPLDSADRESSGSLPGRPRDVNRQPGLIMLNAIGSQQRQWIMRAPPSDSAGPQRYRHRFPENVDKKNVGQRVGKCIPPRQFVEPISVGYEQKHYHYG